jgi:hypothetical protein
MNPLDEPCTYCQQPAGHKCRKPNGHTMQTPHAGRCGTPRNWKYQQLIEEIDFLENTWGATPQYIADRLNTTMHAIARAMQRHGHHERARPYQRAHNATLKETL